MESKFYVSSIYVDPQRSLFLVLGFGTLFICFESLRHLLLLGISNFTSGENWEGFFRGETEISGISALEELEIVESECFKGIWILPETLRRTIFFLRFLTLFLFCLKACSFILLSRLWEKLNPLEGATLSWRGIDAYVDSSSLLPNFWVSSSGGSVVYVRY